MHVVVEDIEHDQDCVIEMTSDGCSVKFERQKQGVTEDAFLGSRGGGMACVGVERDCLSVSFYDNSSEDPAVRVWFNTDTRRWVVKTEST